MTADPHRHPFLDDLAEHVLLTSSVLRGPVSGRERVTRLVKAGGSLYRRQVPSFLGTVGDQGLFEYDIELDDGVPASGLATFRRNAAGAVTHLHVAFSPLGAVLTIAGALRDQLSEELGADLFL
jgi:hypothetical protein